MGGKRRFSGCWYRRRRHRCGCDSVIVDDFNDTLELSVERNRDVVFDASLSTAHHFQLILIALLKKRIVPMPTIRARAQLFSVPILPQACSANNNNNECYRYRHLPDAASGGNQRNRYKQFPGPAGSGDNQKTTFLLEQQRNKQSVHIRVHFVSTNK